MQSANSISRCANQISHTSSRAGRLQGSNWPTASAHAVKRLHRLRGLSRAGSAGPLGHEAAQKVEEKQRKADQKEIEADAVEAQK